MDAVEFLKEKARMTNFCQISCNLCPMRDMFGSHPCKYGQMKNPEKAVAIVEKWSAEHPIETYRTHFLKMFPNAKVLNGIPKVCIEEIYGHLPKLCDECNSDTCKKAWNEPFKEEFK